ncbi:hypothetical protein LTR85_010306 [Meristemomyces frigidus]|nr:hypothetical protein LTR85_010306 [Meristemomyces frigidus]
MAAQIAALNPKLPPTHAGQLLRDFVDAFDSVQEQLRKGTTQAVVPLTKINLLGTEGVAILKKHLEDATNARFTFTVNASANSVTLMPTGPMPPKPSLTAQSLASPAGSASKTAGSKVPRPPNAFIIYRKDWHSRIVAQNPGLHNNAISVIIGEKWKAEQEHVRAEYKRKAEEAKSQHAANNPGYQYQPRKPSEKKKRMTKNKLAKLAAKAEENGNISGDIAQQPLPDDFDPVHMLDEQLGRCADAQPLTINEYGQMHVQQTPILSATSDPNFGGFHAGPDPNDVLRTSLEAFNEANPTLRSRGGPVAFTAQSTINGMGLMYHDLDDDLPGVGFHDAAGTTMAIEQGGLSQNTQENVAVPTASMTKQYKQYAAQIAASAATRVAPHNPVTEVRRQDRLDLEFGDWIDCEAYASSPGPNAVGPTDAEITYDFNGQFGEVDLNNFALAMGGDENGPAIDWANNFDLEWNGNAPAF